ncbi:acyl-CoA dehydrogenase, partial [Amycolatopsis sp. SID8362]
MPVALTDEQAALAEAIHAWSAAHRPREVVRATETGAGLPAGFAALGLFGVALPASVGGADGSIADLAAGLAAAAEELVPGPVLGTALGGLLLADVPAAKELLPALAEGEATVAVLLDAPSLDDGVTGPVPGVDAATWLLVPSGDGHVLLAPGT